MLHHDIHSRANKVRGSVQYMTCVLHGRSNLYAFTGEGKELQGLKRIKRAREVLNPSFYWKTMQDRKKWAADAAQLRGIHIVAILSITPFWWARQFPVFKLVQLLLLQWIGRQIASSCENVLLSYDKATRKHKHATPRYQPQGRTI